MKNTKKLLADKKFFLLDMDGTIYLEDTLFDGTVDFLRHVRERGGKYLFVTNNSSRGTDAYVEKMRRLGIPAGPEDFLTSTEATVLYLRTHYPGKRFYSMGTASFTAQLRAGGIDAVTEVDSSVFGLVISNDTELTFSKLDDACRLLVRGAEYIATNPDWVCPTSYGYVPDCGSFAWMLEKATGRTPRFIGKPHPEMLLLAMDKFGYTKQQTLMIGDRVYTDIASGYNAGVDTVLVLSGESTRADAENAATAPTYIMQNIREVDNNL